MASKAIGKNPANITKSDATTYSPPYDGFVVDVDGDVKIRTPEGDDVTIPSCRAGIPYSFPFDILYSTGTASGITTIAAYFVN